jgi:hypothetical protein
MPFSQLIRSKFYKELRYATVELLYPIGLVTIICYFYFTTAGTPMILPLFVPKKYHSFEFLMKKQFDTTGYSSSNYAK